MHNAVKVLIAEDEPNALMGLAELISGWGYRTETARDGLEAWEKVLAWDPAIVVTDLKMPRLDGIGLLTKLWRRGLRPQLQPGRHCPHRHGLHSSWPLKP
jgi:CheY-like chemotaxis protein